MLSYANAFIDTFQGAKHIFLNTIVTESKVREPLAAFIDAETSFVKEIAKISDSVYGQVTEQVKKFTYTK
jgi:hypothetical protein